MVSFRYIPALLLLLSLVVFRANAQPADTVFRQHIRTVQLYTSGNQQGLPVYRLNSADQVELHFDDLEGGVRNYYYTFILCDYNWQPAQLNSFDFIKGFTLQRINTYRLSSVAFIRYTHYQAFLPDRNCMPSRSGNYIVKVFLDGDTSKKIFTKRLLVVDQKATTGGQVVQPFAPQLYRTHQKLLYSVNIGGLNAFSAAQQVKVVILQNNRWDNALWGVAPTFVRGNILEYNTENMSVFPAGKEWRWLDLRSFRLLSDRVQTGEYKPGKAEIYLKPDIDRTGQKYSFFRDFNGMYNIETFESVNPFWQTDYANIHFSFATADGKPLPGKDIYINGQLTDYKQDNKSRMVFNDSTGTYHGSLYLKQGFYNYGYMAVDRNTRQRNELEGNYFETENLYTILVYFRAFADRADQLISIGTIQSQVGRSGVSF